MHSPFHARGALGSRRRTRALAGATLALTLALAGCASTGSDTGGTATSVAPDPEFASLLSAQVDLGYEGTSALPQLDPVTAISGKNVWLIEVGLSAGSPVETADGFKAAGEKLGWDVTVFDGKFDPTQWLAGIRQAIAAKADAIWIYSFDCGPVKAALQEAKSANIPVVLSQGLDCGDGADSLVTYNMKYMGTYNDGVVSKDPGDLEDWAKTFGAGAGWWVIGQTKAQAKIIEFVETDLQTTAWNGEGLEGAVKQCSTCQIVERIDFIGTDLGPKLQQMAEQALLKHPEANAVYGAYDTAMTSGIGAAIRSSGRQNDLVVVGGEGFAANLALLSEGIQDGGTGYPAPWEGWAAADAVLRIFAGAPQPASSGIGYQVYDKDHNLPASDDYKTKLDYTSAYLSGWGLS